MLTLENYFQDFQNTVRTIAAGEGLFTRTAFLQEMTRRLSSVEEVDNLITCEYEGSGSRNRRLLLDGYDFDDEDGQLVVAVADFSSEDDIVRLTTTDAQRKVSGVEAFLIEAIRGGLESQLDESWDVFQMVAELRERLDSISVVRVYLVTNKQMSDSIKSFDDAEVEGTKLEFHIWDIERFFRVESSQLGREEIDIDLTTWIPSGLAALPASRDNSEITTFLAVVPGEILAEIYRIYGSRVLESNVRSFLSARAKVNRGIRGTIMQEPDMFLPYNNGVTATATSIEGEFSNDGYRIKRIQNLQIVNGGQTTASLFYVRKNDKAPLNGVNVQMKLIVVDELRAEELVPKISRYANTQNRVSEADFFSNHPFHQRMEEKSRQILAPAHPGEYFQTKWFYERTRGQYLNEKSRSTAAEAKKFEMEYPKSQLLTKTDAAKYLVSWLQKPQVVSSGAQKNFLAFAELVSGQWEKGDAQFGDSYFKELVAKGILFHGIRKQVNASDWYSSGYLANIVTYGIAKFAHAIETQRSGREFDFEIIWNLQRLPMELLEILQGVSKIVFDVLTDERRPVVNVTEWAKKDACWSRVKEVEYDLPDITDEFLLSRSEVKKVKAESAKSQKVDSGISDQVKVYELGANHWKKAREFAMRVGALSEKEDSILKIALNPSGAKVASELQCKVLMELNRRLTEIGFAGR